CLVPGTEVVFDRAPEIDAGRAKLPKRAAGDALARFRRVNDDRPYLPHDALEFADGEIVLLAQLAENQTATVIRIAISAAGVADDQPSQLASLNALAQMSDGLELAGEGLVHTRVHRHHTCREDCRQPPVASDQIFLKIPLRYGKRALRRRPAIEWMRIWPTQN